MKSILILIATLLAFGTKSSETVIFGQVTADEKIRVNVVGVQVELRFDTTVIASTIIGKDLTFSMPAAFDKKVDLYYKSVGVEDAFIQSISPTELDTVKIAFELPKAYKKKLGKVTCPECNKSDQTVPIQYGMGSAMLVPYMDLDGNEIFLPYDRNNYYAGSCVTSHIDPQYFCKRDAIKF
jgi:hypothetical protein